MRTMTNAGRWKLLVIVGLLAYAAVASIDVTSFSQGPNNRNVSVDTTVNITNAVPEILNVTLNQEGQPIAANITLNAGTTTLVLCNVSAFDYNGGSTILSANATLYATATANSSSQDDNNEHYTNASCAVTGTDGIYRNFSCSFPVQYYADVGFWECNATVMDDYPFNTSGAETTHIDSILALNVTQLIDYGDLAVGDTSAVQEANVTNIGNTNINVSVQGYGSALNDGLAFVCDVGNISIENEKYNVTDNGQNIGQYYNLSSSLAQVPGMTVVQQTNDSQQELNTTYWILFVPPNPFGVCNGTIVFQAEAS